MPAHAKLARARLVRQMPSDVVWGWVGPLLIAAFAGILRFWRLGNPKSFVFDETYYAKDAYALLKYGVEQNFVKGDDTTKDLANQRILAGDLDHVFAGSPDTASAARTAEGPGTTVTVTPASTAAATNRKPGSDTDGIPASVTSTTRSPDFKAVSSSSVRATSLASS